MLVLTPALTLLAAGALPSLRRGAASAFNWFSAMNFAVFAVLVWLAWTAQVLHWPTGLARHIARVTPSFVVSNPVTATVTGIGFCILWITLAWHLPKTPGRAAANWTMGMTMLWCVGVTLLLPWFDHSRSYRPMIEELKTTLAAYPGEAIASETPLPDAMRSMLDYYAKVRTHPIEDSATPHGLLLLYVDHKSEAPGDRPGWKLVRTLRHGGGKQLESLYLYTRSDRD